MKHIDWQRSPIRFKAMTGLSTEDFYALLPYFEDAHDEYLSKYKMNGKPRNGIRRYSMYANAPLPNVAERLAFVLSYNKLNPIQEAHADLFGIEQYQCHEFVHAFNKMLDMALEEAGCMPARTNKELQQVLSNTDKAEDSVLLHDGTEREIPRPVYDDLQEENYSGKKKKHTVKNAIVINALCVILFVSLTHAGRVHDKTLADTCYTFPPRCEVWQDTGYQGYRPDGVKVYQPKKKPKGGELTMPEKECNRQISAYRVRVEHAIGSTKRYRIVKDECRLRKNNFVRHILHTCAALHNFRIKQNPFKYQVAHEISI
jgi:hypothetical protein